MSNDLKKNGKKPGQLNEFIRKLKDRMLDINIQSENLAREKIFKEWNI